MVPKHMGSPVNHLLLSVGQLWRADGMRDAVSSARLWLSRCRMYHLTLVRWGGASMKSIYCLRASTPTIGRVVRALLTHFRLAVH